MVSACHSSEKRKPGPDSHARWPALEDPVGILLLLRAGRRLPGHRPEQRLPRARGRPVGEDVYGEARIGVAAAIVDGAGVRPRGQQHSHQVPGGRQRGEMDGLHPVLIHGGDLGAALEQHLRGGHVPLFGGPHERRDPDGAIGDLSEPVLLLRARPDESVASRLDPSAVLYCVDDAGHVAPGSRIDQSPICERAPVPSFADAGDREHLLRLRGAT
mmetsp:Transcript_118843/g.341221  ORF Transcript_118843/g.341221 Transcript_118843/m.341221 type:complete len:215 (+) Transcript_118843:18-662(+)